MCYKVRNVDGIYFQQVSARADFEMFSKRLPAPIMSTSGGQAVQEREALFKSYGPQASVSKADFGRWIVPTDGDLESHMLQFTDISGSGRKEHDQEDKLDLSILMSKLWVSAILRDNIVTTFGYVLNRPDNPLPEELYSSLYIIYNFIRLRRIQTVDLLPVLKQMSYSSPQEQFLILFEELHRRIPSYLKGVAAQWVEALSRNQVSLNDMIRPGKGPAEVDFLASFEHSVLDVLETKTVFNKETIEQSSAKIKVLMGPLFSNIFVAIADGSMQLTQSLFALILLHLPLDKIVPQKDETERHMVDALRLNSSDRWELIIEKLKPQDLKDPFKLVRSVLQSIGDDPEFDMEMKQDAAFILPYVKPITQTFANPLYAIMSEILGQPDIKFKALLRHITELEYPQEVVELKDRLLYYIKQGYIDMEFVVTGFIRYDYVTPSDLLIAMLTRIRHRAPNLSDEILATVKALEQALIFRKIHSSLSPVVPLDAIYFPSLLDAFGNPSLPTKVRELERLISDLLVKEEIDWASLVDLIPTEQCSSPKQCFVTVMTKAISQGMLMNSPALVYIEELLYMVDRFGRMRKNLTGSSLGGPKVEATTIPTSYDASNTTRTPTTTPKPQEEASKPFNTTKGIWVATIATPATPPAENNTMPKMTLVSQPIRALMKAAYPTLMPLINFPPFNSNILYVPVNIDRLEQLLPPTIPFSGEDILLKPLRDFIVRPDLLAILGADFQPEKYKTKASLLRGILEKALETDVVKMNNPLYVLVKRFLKYLVEQMDAFKPSINFTALLEALPHATNEGEFKIFQNLRNFITSTQIYKYITNFDVMKYKTRGVLLQNLLQYLLNLDEIKLNADLYRSIQYYVDKVYQNGFGAKPTEYIIVRQKEQRRVIDLQSTFKAIDFKKLDSQGQKALHGVYRFFAEEFQAPIHLSDFESMEYKTKGEWLTAYLRYLVKHQAVSPEARRDISYILPYVLLTGPGAELVDELQRN
jgi:hypothetical protein